MPDFLYWKLTVELDLRVPSGFFWPYEWDAWRRNRAMGFPFDANFALKTFKRVSCPWRIGNWNIQINTQFIRFDVKICFLVVLEKSVLPKNWKPQPSISVINSWLSLSYVQSNRDQSYSFFVRDSTLRASPQIDFFFLRNSWRRISIRGSNP